MRRIDPVVQCNKTHLRQRRHVLTSNKEVARLARHLSTTAKVGDKFDHDMVGTISA